MVSPILIPHLRVKLKNIARMVADVTTGLTYMTNDDKRVAGVAEVDCLEAFRGIRDQANQCMLLLARALAGHDEEKTKTRKDERLEMFQAKVQEAHQQYLAAVSNAETREFLDSLLEIVDSHLMELGTRRAS
ncbi:MAG TPA: hypothetical protein VEJ17_01025 [Candidatus Nitrosotalea sp.]|nr:hypothetical protein [Candidatus Nitrosotalea sp.]